MRPFIIIVLFITSITNLLAQKKKVVGYYLSNFAIGNFFMTQIQLNLDGTFKYEEAGDMFHDWGSGSYKIFNDTIYFEYFPGTRDTFRQVIIDSIGKESIYKLPKRHFDRPQKIYWKKGKLFKIGPDGKLKTKEIKNSWSTKRYNYYLSRRKNLKWEDWP